MGKLPGKPSGKVHLIRLKRNGLHWNIASHCGYAVASQTQSHAVSEVSDAVRAACVAALAIHITEFAESQETA